MSELNPLNGGKKSKILEERRLREEREQQRIRKQERERRNKKRKRQQIALISIFTVFTPPPKVKSAVIRLRRNRVGRLGCDEALFVKVVKAS